MKLKYLALALLTTTLAFEQSKAEYDFSAPFVDSRFGATGSEHEKLLSVRQDAQKFFWLKDSLFTTYLEKDSATIKELYTRIAKDVDPPKAMFRLPLDMIQYPDMSATSLLTYLFKNYDDKGTINFDVPIVVHLDDNRPNNAYDEHYDADSACLGMGFLEAEIKGKCFHDKRINYGLIELNYSKSLNSLQAQQNILQLPNNGNVESYSYKLFNAYPLLLGIYSHHDILGFRYPLSTFDRHIYSENRKSFTKPFTMFAEFGDKCSIYNQKNCDLYFVGKNSSALWGQKFSSLDNFTLDPEHNLKIFISDKKPYLDVKNAILSSSEFVNYGFYTEAEMMVLKDLGYNINSREFFGSSIYSSGSKNNLLKHELKDGYYAWSDSSSEYDTNKVSRVPLGIGTHIYGDFNEVIQNSTIASIGYGSIGVRIDGQGNIYTLPHNQAIYENGYAASGIAVSYGRDNILNIEGSVDADFDEGIGINLNFGSNSRSDLLEYRGSYMRVRTRDVYDGKLSREQGIAYEVPEEIRGPLVSQLNISGSVSGKKQAIYIDSTAHVRQINFLKRARITGDIISEWRPYIKDDVLYEKSTNLSVFPAALQFDPLSDNLRRGSFKTEALHTNMNFGVMRNRSYTEGNSSFHFVPDKKASITVTGDVRGKSLNISSFGGRTRFNGSVNVYRMYISNSVVLIKTANEKINSFSELVLKSGGQLNLTNGVFDEIFVDNRSEISGNSVICVDTDRNANIIDKVIFRGSFNAPDGVVNLEPGLSYNDIKSYSSDPKAFLTFINDFVKNSNKALRKYGVNSKFPKHIWYAQGDLGRTLLCSSRGCYLGDFVNSYAKSLEPLPYWRYALSFIGCVLLIAGSLLFPRFAKYLHTN